jgi:hypothetical protein
MKIEKASMLRVPSFSPCKDADTHIYTNTHKHTHINTHSHTYIYIHTHKHILTHSHTHIYIQKHTHTHTHILTYNNPNLFYHWTPIPPTISDSIPPNCSYQNSFLTCEDSNYAYMAGCQADLSSLMTHLSLQAALIHNSHDNIPNPPSIQGIIC